MKSITSLILLIFLVVQSSGNNISITNVTLTGQNTSAGVNNAANFALVQFNVSWENSWRMSIGPSNWDAAWLFVKYRVNGAGDWHHVNLNNTGHTVPAGSTIDAGLLTPGSAFNNTTNPAIGVFLYRNVNGSGTFSANNIQLRWNYGSQGISDNFPIEVQVFGVEMVYIPTGAFNVGGGGGGVAFTSTTINTGNATTIPSGSGILGGQGGGYPTGQITPANASWSNGYSNFYCMKYEITQNQYVDFLNTLTRTQQAYHIATSISNTTSVSNRYVMNGGSIMDSRNGIRCDAVIPAAPIPVNFYCDYSGNGIGNEGSDGNCIACNFIYWPDLAAYLDWSGLRPFTEMEFEKICRGILPAVPGEYAWGNGNIISATSLNAAGSEGEITSIFSNINYDDNSGVPGPVRVGCFSQGNTNREQSGASYYGVTEMSGNLLEMIVNIATVEGRAFTGLHGDGVISAGGDANVNNWPGSNSVGAGMKGGHFEDSGDDAYVSQRQRITIISPRPVPGSLDPRSGGRGVRTAP